MLTQAASKDIEKDTFEPRLGGTQIRAPIAIKDHQQNTGGRDGAGLCVIASTVMGARYLGYREEADLLWSEAKKDEGGYWPDKWDKFADRVCPDLTYAHYIGSDFEVLKKLSESGLPVGSTMDTGSLYGYESIEHMVEVVHADEKLVCFIDNNKPGVYTWVSRAEWERRAKLNRGTFWLLVLAGKSKSELRSTLLAVFVVGLLILSLGVPVNGRNQNRGRAQRVLGQRKA